VWPSMISNRGSECTKHPQAGVHISLVKSNFFPAIPAPARCRLPLRGVGKGGIIVLPDSCLPPMVREEASAGALKDCRKLTKAQTIDQHEVVALRETREAGIPKNRETLHGSENRVLRLLLKPYQLLPPHAVKRASVY